MEWNTDRYRLSTTNRGCVEKNEKIVTIPTTLSYLESYCLLAVAMSSAFHALPFLFLFFLGIHRPSRNLISASSRVPSQRTRTHIADMLLHLGCVALYIHQRLSPPFHTECCPAGTPPAQSSATAKAAARDTRTRDARAMAEAAPVAISSPPR
jgi:hypothetical protein